MKIAVVYNRGTGNVINLFGMPNRETIALKTIGRVVSALTEGGHQVVALEGTRTWSPASSSSCRGWSSSPAHARRSPHPRTAAARGVARRHGGDRALPCDRSRRGGRGQRLRRGRGGGFRAGRLRARRVGPRREASLLQHALARREARFLRAGTAAPLFLRDGKRPYRAGDVFRQPVLGTTLRRLAERGVDDFYQGEIAAAMEADMERHDGFLRRDDLAQIPMPIERRPLTGRLFGHRVFTMQELAGRRLVAVDWRKRYGRDSMNTRKTTGFIGVAIRTRRVRPRFHPRTTVAHARDRCHRGRGGPGAVRARRVTPVQNARRCDTSPQARTTPLS